MANEVTVTTAANFIPEIWSKEVQKAVENNLVLAARVKRFDSEVKGGGDTLHIPTLSNITASDKSAGSDVTFTANTEGVVNLSINKHKVAGVDIEDIVKTQASYNMSSLYSDKLGYAIAKIIDSDLAALETGLSQNLGTAGTDLTDAVIVNGIIFLDEADAPLADRHFVIEPSQKGAILKLDKFVLYQNANRERVINGELGEVYGVEIAITNNLKVTATPTAVHNLLFHRECFAMAMQQDIRVQSQYEIASLSNRIVADAIYGVVEYRDAFGVDIIS